MIFNGVELPSLLTQERAAEVLGIEAAVVARWVAEGKLDSVHVNGRIRVIASSVVDRLGQETPLRTDNPAKA